MYPGTFYLVKVDEKWRRFYKIKGKEETQFDWTGTVAGKPQKTESGPAARLNALEKQFK